MTKVVIANNHSNDNNNDSHENNNDGNGYNDTNSNITK